MRQWLPAAILCAAMPVIAQTTSPVREQRERELVLVTHIHRHLLAPGDGVALASDRRDLQRVRAGTPDVSPSAQPASPVQTDDALLDALSVMADLWQARVNDRIPFARMRDRASAITRAQQALGQLQSRAGNDRSDFLIEMHNELAALARFAAGQGDVSEAGIDLALSLADQAATGRPAAAPGAYPAPLPGAAPPPGPLVEPSAAYPPLVPSPVMPPGPPLPPATGSTPYTLPAGYAGYTADAATAAGTIASCQVLRQSAGVSASAVDMLRTAECWSRLTAWRGWAAQTGEALDWAMNYARIDRDCRALGDAIDRLRELGRAMAAEGSIDVTSLAARGEADRRRLKAAGQCE